MHPAPTLNPSQDTSMDVYPGAQADEALNLIFRSSLPKNLEV